MAGRIELFLIIAGSIVWFCFFVYLFFNRVLAKRATFGFSFSYEALPRSRDIYPFAKVDADRLQVSYIDVFYFLLIFFAVNALAYWSIQHLGPRIGLDSLLHLNNLTRASDVQFARRMFADLIAKVFIAVILGLYVYREGLWSFGGVLSFRTIASALLVSLAVFPLVNVICVGLSNYILTNIGITSIEDHPAVGFLKSSAFVHLKLLAIVLAILVSPFSEELFFRGLVQNYIFGKTGAIWPAIIGAAFFFSLAHLPLYNHILPIFVLGIVLGWSYYRFGTLLCPIIVHMVFNLWTVLLWATARV